VRKDVYSGGSESVSYSEYYRYDSWGNLVYTKDPSDHETFYSYANTDTTGFFVDYDGAIVKEFTNGFIESSVPSSVHTVMLGMAERQGNGNMVEFYHEYTGPDLTEAHSLYGPQTTWLTFSGTFNEKTGQTSFPIDLAGYTVAGNGVFQITGLPSDDNYQESHSYSCEGQCNANCKSVSGSWQGGSYKLNYKCCRYELGEVVCGTDKTAYIDSFAHYPGTLGYQSYSTTPGMNQMFTTFLVKTFWKAYPAEVQYNLDQSTWKTVTSNLMNGQKQITVPITDGTHTLYFSESSGYQTKFSWNLYVPVDATSDTYATTYTYDQYGNMTSVTNPQGHTTTYEYSADYDHAYLTSQTDMVSGQEITVSATYDFDLGLVNSRTCACGSVTDYEYDVLGRMTKIIYPLVLGEQERAEYEVIYDDVNGTVTLFNENDEKTIRYYDGLNRMVKEERYTDVLWAVSEYSYNYLDKLKQATDPLSRVYQYEYDAVGRATKFINPDYTYSMLQYDDLNDIATLQDGNQHTKDYTFDWAGNLVSVKEHNGAATYETQYQYDELGNLTQMTNPEQDVYTYEYDSLFGITEAVYPDSTEQHFSYDAVGNLIERVDQNGTAITYTYDAVSRLMEIDYQDQSVSFTYNQVGQRTSMVTPDVTTYYQYDERNRLNEIEYVIDSTSYVIQYAFDPAGNITQITYPDDSVVQYTYFLKDLPESIQGFATFSYLADGSLETINFSNGVTTDYGYNSTGKIQTFDAYTGTDLLDLEYTYDDAGNITQISNDYSTAYQQWMTTTESYTYDDLNKLTSASNGFGTISYEYDSTKRLSIDESGQVTFYTYDYDLLMSSGTTTYTYDSNGNTLTKSGDSEWGYHYDNANRLIEVDKDDQMVAEHVYDGDGKRIKKTEWSDSLQDYETTLYMYSGGNVIYGENETGTATYVYGPSGRIVKQTTINNETTTYYYHTDHLGSTRMVTDETGTPLTSVTYYPFGRTNECTGSSQSYLFIGKERDATGLYYLNQRYYDPETGRFITRDPYTWLPDDLRSCGHSGDLVRWLITPQRFDGYSYAENNPIRYSDPTGLSRYLECCDNQACTNFCADDGSHNSNPGGSEGSQKYSIGDPDDQSENSQEGKSEECDEECQRQKRLSEQEKCKEDCLKIPHIKQLWEKRNHLNKKKFLLEIGSLVGGIIIGAFAPPIGIVFGVTLFTGPTVGTILDLKAVEQELRDQGCACVM
jgi:RHS repeat-associated protein